MTNSRPRRAALAIDLALGAALLASSAWVAHAHLADTRPKALAEWEILPAAMLACGHGFTQPALGRPVVQDFVLRKREAVSCEALAGDRAPGPAVQIAGAHRYSIGAVAASLRVGGLSWSTLDAHLAGLFAVSMVLAYALFRQGVGHVLAALGVVALIVSDLLATLASLRDLAKLPCFLAVWLALAWIVRRGGEPAPARLAVPAVVAGALLGVGLGFRVDVLVCAPVLVAAIVLAVPGFTGPDLRRKAIATALGVAAFGLTGAPILASMAGGSNSAHVVVLGLMTPFDRLLGIEPAPYDVGATYSDGFAYTVIAAHGVLVQEQTPPIAWGDDRYDRIGGALLADLAGHFPADGITRAVAATAQILRYPFDWQIRAAVAGLPGIAESPSLRRVAAWRERALGWIDGHELWLAGAVLLLVAVRDPRAGVLLACLTLYFCGYTMLQFARRHTFHLDIVPIGAVLLLVHAALSVRWRWSGPLRVAARDTWRRAGRQAFPGLAVMAGLILVAMATWAAARWWQQAHVVTLLAATLDTAWEPVASTREPLADSILADGLPSPSWYDIYHPAPERWADASLLRVAVAATPLAPPGAVHTEYFRLAFADRCGADRVSVGVKYTGSEPSYHREFTREIRVPVSADGPSQVLVPVFYQGGTAWSRFDGFAIPAAHAACLSGLWRAADPRQLPLPILAAALPPGWRERPLYQRLRAHPEMTLAGTPVTPAPPAEARRAGWFDEPGRPFATAAPPLTEWSAGEGVHVTPVAEGHVVAGNAMEWGYQLVSPPVAVPPGRLLAARVEGVVEDGRLCFGVLDGAQQAWLLPPDGGQPVFLVDPGAHAQVYFVFANCGGATPGRARIRSVTYQFARQR